jgi:hypothetical protein
MTFFQDLAIAEVVIGDIETFAQNAPVAVNSVTVAGVTISGSVVRLPNGPTAQFAAITNIGGVIGLGFVAAAGAPVSFAEKIGNTWIGYTLSVVKAA